MSGLNFATYTEMARTMVIVSSSMRELQERIAKALFERDREHEAVVRLCGRDIDEARVAEARLRGALEEIWRVPVGEGPQSYKKYEIAAAALDTPPSQLYERYQKLETLLTAVTNHAEEVEEHGSADWDEIDKALEAFKS